MIHITGTVNGNLDIFFKNKNRFVQDPRAYRIQNTDTLLPNLGP